MTRRPWVPLLAFTLLVSVPVLATTARELSVDALSTESDVVVIGRCVEITTTWMDRTLVRIATIRVDEQLLGGASTITVVMPGGIDANRAVPVAMLYPGAPTMSVGEEMFLFLDDETATLGGYTVAGFSQGKFSILTDPRGQKVVSRDLTGLELQNAGGVRRGTRTVVPLTEFTDQVRRHLANR
jgi:hypothetical protein